MTNNDTTPNDDLRELVVRWENAAHFAKEQDEIGEYDGIMSCVHELEELIEE